ncbi:olfactory receptor 4M1-like [Hoplias malabaricus]|uniref:olfactory receptor 4M1-like n=1 Tax=Hoplias malabaricus TaxID=27720 RepID=UPI0034619908
MANTTQGPLGVLNSIFVLSSIELSREGAYATIIVSFSAYIFSMVTNLLLMVIVAVNRSLHEPMYILLCNLSLNDIISISALVPRAVFDIMFKNDIITFPAFFLQAWCLHIYGAAAVLILSAMAFDRYIAICYPLRYHTIMSRAAVTYLIVLTWSASFVIVMIVFALTLQYPFCRKQLSYYYCDNMSILSLTCATDTTVNNIFGLFVAGFLHVFGVLSVIFSYTSILITCYKSNDSESKSKAWNTCSTHLSVFVIYEISSSAVVLTHRFPNAPPTLQKILAMIGVIIPCCFNPVIYGLKSKDIKSKVIILRNKYMWRTF